MIPPMAPGPSARAATRNSRPSSSLKSSTANSGRRSISVHAADGHLIFDKT